MSTQPQTEQTQALARTSPLILELASEWKMSPKTMIDTLKATIFPQKDANNNPIVVSDAQLMAFLQVANEYRLNPFLRELYAFPTKGGGIVPMVPIDGWANIVNRRPEMDGVEFVDEWEVDDRNRRVGAIPFSTTCIIYRKDRTHATKVTEYFAECNQPTKEPWKKWPARMLRHKSFIQCARIAFSLAGIYDPDEAERIAESGEDKPKPIERPKIVEGTVSTEKRTAPAQVEQESQAEPIKQEASKVEERPTSAATSTPAPSAVAPGSQNQPTGEDLFPNPAQTVEYVPTQKLSKLFVIARTVWGSKEDVYLPAVHKFLHENFSIESTKKIPVEQLDIIVDAISKQIGKK